MTGMRRLVLTALLVLLSGCQEAHPFLMVKVCLGDERNARMFVDLMESISDDHRMRYIDRSIATGKELSVLQAAPDYPVINVSAVGANGIGWGAGNFGQSAYEVAIGFSAGSDPAEARRFADATIAELKKRWRVHVIPPGRGATPSDTGACAGSLKADATGAVRYQLAVPLGSGVDVRHAVYRKEPLGGKWLLQMKRKSGLALASHDGGNVSSLSEAEFAELVSGLLALIHEEHHDRLDSIQVDLALVEPLASGAVDYLRNAAMATDYAVEPKSDVILAAMQAYLEESVLVERVCEQVATIGRRCTQHPVSMNPIAIESPHLRKQWGEVKGLPDAGIEKETVWFAIHLAEQ